jgi:phage/plasmid-like protein (TIGR03299 family)
MPDRVGKMFYYKERPWHGKGIALDHPATAEEAIKHGGLDWEVEKVPIVTADGTPIKRRVAIVRKDLSHSDPNRVLGIVYPGFKPLQNKEAVALFDCLVGKGEPVYHTGGYLGNGEVIWLLAELPDKFKILARDDDEVRLFMLFTNSHDGTIAVDIRITAVRVVCWNTLKMALSDRSRFVYKRWHRGDYESIPQEIEALLEREKAAIQEQFRKMAQRVLTEDEFRQVLERLLPDPKPPQKQDERSRREYERRLERIRKEREAILRIFVEGATLNGQRIEPEENAWGALNAVTAYVDHFRDVKNGDRYAHIHFGYGARLKEQAYKLLSHPL